MSGAHALQPLQPGEEAHRQAAVHEAVVHDDVREPEGGHARPGPDGNRCGQPPQVAAEHDEPGREWRVGRGEHVVELEAASPASVVRAMNSPQRTVPDASVEEARPGLHRECDDQRDGHADRDARDGRHEETS
jgi:hypothetical protein